jgi:capsule polysaccharide export protein KpsE/RkpR
MVEAAALLQGQLIAAQSQYEGLREIYTDNNPRVRTVKARIDELQRQLEKLGGKGESATTISSQSGESMYPSIRKLPLLGVTYADLFRRTKIQEAVLEILTKEYEMAKVQEVKEIPTVKVLDIAQIPDKNSFPPRLLIIVFVTVFSLALATTWIFVKTMWDETDSKDERKIFAQEVLSTVTACVPVFSKNGSENPSVNGGVWGRFRRGEISGSIDPKSHELGH